MVLLDTHILLWVFKDANRLPLHVKQILQQEDRSISICSLWEIAIKSALPNEKRRIHLEHGIGEIIESCFQEGIDVLPISFEDCEITQTLPHIHGDPFDRMIIAQAMTRGLPLITKDENIWKYPGIETIW